jgi:hypothetical protein
LVTEAPLFSAYPPGPLACATILYQPLLQAPYWMVVLHELE